MALRWLATGAAALAMAVATEALAEEARIAPLGFTAADVTPALAKKHELFLKDMLRGGVVVTAAREGASVRVGDHLLKAGGRNIVSAQLLAERAAKLKPGETLALAGLRGAERIAVKAAAPKAEPARPPRKLLAAPLLSLETGGHTAKIRDVIVRGDRLFTASYDKTVRIWSLSKKKLLRVLRGPSGPGDPGKIYA
ncbi:MAG: hypothetical protein MRY74_12860, partial [Neomegalonema sp.]|nr:hypothetical protein [Neomegalonema sp.]